jgi:hypothetical protein
MALDPVLLYKNLKKLSNFNNSVDAANAWSQAYFTYAGGATALDAIAVLKPKETLATIILPSMRGKSFHLDLGNLLTVYWLGTPFIGKLNNGPITLATGASVLTAKMLKLSNTAMAGIQKDYLQEFAAALDGFTRTVVANLVNSAGAVIPTPIS